MQQIIEIKVNNVSLYTTHNKGVNAERVLKMEQIMSHVRHTGRLYNGHNWYPILWMILKN
jgi:hypothetical protein